MREREAGQPSTNVLLIDSGVAMRRKKLSRYSFISRLCREFSSLTESMAAELRDKGINVNCVLPSIIDTPQNRAAMPDADPRRWVAPAAVAEVIFFLASDAAGAVHGAAIPVVGLS